MEIVSIAEHGDVFLVPLASGEPVKFRVDSYLLRAASPVFAAMFEPGKFAEGQALSRTNPPNIRLPEDDAEAIKIICNVVHHRNQDVPNSLAATAMGRLYAVVHKYELLDTLRFPVSVWLSKAVSASTAIKDQFFMAGIAAAICDKDAFRLLSKEVVLNCKVDFFDLLEDNTEWEVFDWAFRSIIYRLFEPKRAHLRQVFSAAVYAAVTRATSESSKPCTCALEYTNRIVKRIASDRIQPHAVKERSLNGCLKDADAFGYPDNANYQCSDHSRWHCRPLRIREALYSDLKELREFQGIELEG